MMNRLLDTSHKLVDCTMYIIFGVSVKPYIAYITLFYVYYVHSSSYMSHICFYFSGYKDLQSRKETRESAWRSPGWDECVAYTVPLIREMHSRILNPTSFSPTK